MNWSARRKLALTLLFPILCAGCATTDRKVNVLYQPVTVATGMRGDIYLTSSGRETPLGGRAAVQWLVGTVKNREGEKSGNVVTGRSPVDQVMDAFKQELAAAGFTVLSVAKLPAHAAGGVDITAATMELDENFDLVKSDATSRLSIALELWKNGQKVRKLDYRSTLSDFAIKDRDLLLPKLLQKSLQEIMKQAVPEIANILGE